MFSEKLVSLLQTFSKYELNRFRKFLLSPYLNDQQDLTRLFEIADEALRKEEGAFSDLDKATVWERLFPKQKFDDAQLRRLSSDLTQAALRFLVEEARKQDPLGEALELQKVLEKPELQKHLAGVERQIKRLLNEKQSQSADYYLAQFRLRWNIFNRASKFVATADYLDKLLSADFSLECFYLVQKLKFYTAWLQYRGTRAAAGDFPIMPSFWEHIDDVRFKNVPLIGVYRKVIACFAEPENEQHFLELTAILDENAHKLGKEDLRECYQIAQNYCALKVNQGRNEYYQVFFELFKSIIKWNVLLQNGQLSEGVFKNMITISLRLDEFEWAENFIENYASFLPSNIRENARTFNLANLYSHQKKHSKVIELLRNVEYSDIVYALSSKLILVRTYYELTEYIALDSLIDSFRIFIRRNKVISKNQKREYNNFLNFVKKLTALSPSDAKAIEKFKQKVMEGSSVTPKKWLLEKIAELENKTKR